MLRPRVRVNVIMVVYRQYRHVIEWYSRCVLIEWVYRYNHKIQLIVWYNGKIVRYDTIQPTIQVQIQV